MLKSIFIKEWSKVAYYFLFSIILSIFILSYFAFDLNFYFTTIEPESMMWYKFIQLEQKPHFSQIYFYLAFAIILSFVQYLSEIVQNRIKVTLHQPFNLPNIAFSHLLVGILILTVFYTFYSLTLLSIMAHYYTEQVVQVIFEDTLAFSFASIILYIILSSLIIEKDKKIVILKAILLVLFLFTFIKEQYDYLDLVWIFALFLSPFLFLDSFYSIKEQRLNKVFKVVLVISIFLLIVLSFITYKESYKKEFHKYYIFYSDILDEFVYQKNFGEHKFEYGIKDKKTFSQKEYESYLPFVYYRDLEIQKKLPIKIKETLYGSNEIKNSKLSFEYSYKMLEQKQIKLYPLFNPQSDMGMIKFPEEFFGIFKDEAKIYNYDNGYLRNKSDELNKKLKELDFSYPAKNIWGKTTNIKPSDLGYMILDSKNRLFNLKKEDDKLTMKEIIYPENKEPIYINISENRQQKLSGYAIDKNSNFYLLTWDFRFIKLDLKDFDYKKMRLKLIADPLHYLIRYDDTNSYSATIFTKENYKKIKEDKWD